MIRQIKNNQGITIIEVLITVAVLAIVIVIIYEFIISSSRLQVYVTQQATAIYDAQRSLESIGKEIREAADGDDGSWPIELADDNTLIIYSDIDTDEATERVRYYLAGTEFRKETTEPIGFPIQYTGEQKTTVLSYHVTNSENPIFTYYNQDYPTDVIYNPLETPADVTETMLVHIHLEINVNPTNIPDTFSVDSDIQIRNLKTNL